MMDEIRNAYTKEAKIYDAVRFESKVGRFYYEVEKRRILECLKGPKILELGCGTGRYAIPFAKRGFDYTGIDITPAMLEVAREKAEREHLNPRLLIMDAHDLKFEENTFDSVFCDRTFKFLDPVRALGEAYRVLKPGGRIVIDTEIRKELVTRLPLKRLTQFICWNLTVKKSVRNLDGSGKTILAEKLYTGAELERMLGLAGFRILECARMLWLPALLVRLLPDFALKGLGTKTRIEKIRGPKLLTVGEK